MGAEVAIVTVLPLCIAPPREVALGTALMVTLSGVIAGAARVSGASVTT